jgi:hypothetical protein
MRIKVLNINDDLLCYLCQQLEEFASEIMLKPSDIQIPLFPETSLPLQLRKQFPFIQPCICYYTKTILMVSELNNISENNYYFCSDELVIPKFIHTYRSTQ